MEVYYNINLSTFMIYKPAFLCHCSSLYYEVCSGNYIYTNGYKIQRELVFIWAHDSLRMTQTQDMYLQLPAAFIFPKTHNDQYHMLPTEIIKCERSPARLPPALPQPPTPFSSYKRNKNRRSKRHFSTWLGCIVNRGNVWVPMSFHYNVLSILTS